MGCRRYGAATTETRQRKLLVSIVLFMTDDTVTQNKKDTMEKQKQRPIAILVVMLIFVITIGYPVLREKNIYRALDINLKVCIYIGLVTFGVGLLFLLGKMATRKINPTKKKKTGDKKGSS